MIVVDASVAVKWFLPETGSDAAGALLRSSDKLFAPELIRVEVASALVRRVRLGELDADDAIAAADLWAAALASGVVTLQDNAVDLRQAVLLGSALRHPLQDCLYLACAMRNRAVLMTADARFRAKAASTYEAIRGLDA